MTTSSINIPLAFPKWLKLVASIGAVWYAFGLLQFWLGYSLDTTAAVASGAITQAHAAAIDGTPLLIWLAFAMASAAGLLGAILLFSGSALAKRVFAFSALSALAYYVWIYAISGTGADRPSEEGIIALVVVAVTLGFVALSRRMT